MPRSDGWRPQRPTGRDSPRSEPAANYSFSSRHEFSGSVAVDETIPESTILAIREFQTDTPGLRDVSIRFHAGSAEAAAFIDLAPYGYPLSGPVYTSFRVAVNETIQESTVLAIREFQTDTPGLRDVSIRFHHGSAEAAAFIDLAPYGYPLSGPVYTSFRVAVAGPKRVTVTLDALDFGRLGVPGDIRARAEDALNGYLATRLAQIDGLEITTLAFRESAVTFAGSLPTTYQASPPQPGAMP